jgi:NADH-quinone oxidoreductase subunit N
MNAVLAETLKGAKVNWLYMSPLVVLLGGAMLLITVAVLTPQWPKRLFALCSVAIATTAAVLGVVLWHRVDQVGSLRIIGQSMILDKTTVWVTITLSIAVALVSLVTDGYLRRESIDGPEVYALYLIAALGGIVMGSAADLIVLFLGLEVLSISLYVLAASHRRRSKSQESGLKYFILGGFSSAVFLYGIALIYAGAGSTNYGRIVDAFNAVTPSRHHDALVLAGVALVLVGLAFKVAAVPFHFWTPDVYEGAPTPVTAFMASAAKAAAFAAMLRVLLEALPHFVADYRPVLWTITVLTLVGGSVMAVVQTNVKRMLAFSSISHAGFMLVGVEAAAHHVGDPSSSGTGHSAVLVYTLLYAIIVIGTFGVVTAVGRTGDGSTSLAGFRGLGREKPLLALGMTVLLLAQAGVPFTSGFIAKFGTIKAAVEERSYAIAIIAMLAAVIAAFLYLRIMISMWISEPESGDDRREPVAVPALLGVAITLSVGFTLIAGVFPHWLIHLAP